MNKYPTIEACIGNTPLVRLQRLQGETDNTILLKLEGTNPAGSVKDRPALSMINRAEQRGDIKPGDKLIEATSGNTGIALAMAAAVAGRGACFGAGCANSSPSSPSSSSSAMSSAGSGAAGAGGGLVAGADAGRADMTRRIGSPLRETTFIDDTLR